MSAEVVQLPQRDTSIFARRYTDEERAAWYLMWRTADGRSCRKVAARFHLDERTVRSERDASDWVNKANDEDQDDYASSRLGVAAIVVNELVPSIETAKEIRDNKQASPRDRLAAAQWLAGLAGVSPVSKIEQAVVQAPTQQADIVEVQQLTGRSPDELSRLEDAHRSKRKPVTEHDGRRPPR